MKNTKTREVQVHLSVRGYARHKKMIKALAREANKGKKLHSERTSEATIVQQAIEEKYARRAK